MTMTKLPTVVASEPVRRCRVPLTRLGKGETWLRRQILAFRARLEDAVAEAQGGINEAAAMVIASASVALREAKRCERRRARDAEKLSLEDELSLSDRIVRNYAAAERAVCKLGLTVGAVKDPWDAIYHGNGQSAAEDRVHGTGTDEADDPAKDAADGASDDVGGGNGGAG